MFGSKQRKKEEFQAWANERYQEFAKNRELRESFDRQIAAERIDRLCDQAWDGVTYKVPPMFFVDSNGQPHLVKMD